MSACTWSVSLFLSFRPEDDPYRVTLRKLWKKMVEKDWRTTTKALYLLHALSRQAPVKNSRALSRTLKAMLPEVDAKTGRKYFNRRELLALAPARDGSENPKVALVDAYAGFVLRRALLFAAKFEDVSPKKKDKDGTCAAVVVEVQRAQNALLTLEHAAVFLELAAADARGQPRDAPAFSTETGLDFRILCVGCFCVSGWRKLGVWALECVRSSVFSEPYV